MHREQRLRRRQQRLRRASNGHGDASGGYGDAWGGRTATAETATVVLPLGTRAGQRVLGGRQRLRRHDDRVSSYASGRR